MNQWIHLYILFRFCFNFLLIKMPSRNLFANQYTLYCSITDNRFSHISVTKKQIKIWIILLVSLVNSKIVSCCEDSNTFSLKINFLRDLGFQIILGLLVKLSNFLNRKSFWYGLQYQREDLYAKNSTAVLVAHGMFRAL